MKTTIEIPDELFAEVKSTAAKRKTTMKAMIEHALRREVSFSPEPSADAAFTLDEYGFPVLKKTGNKAVTNEMIYRMMEEEGI